LVLRCPLKDDGDIEVFLDAEEAAKLAHALEQASSAVD